jgi:hypothetical protein
VKKLLALLLLCFSAQAATYYVAKTGNNTTGDGSSGNPWLTIAKAESTATAAGSIIRIQVGSYDEQPTISHSGSAGSFRTFVADGAVICRGFQIPSASYIRLVGIEITHNGTTFSDAIGISGTSSHIEIWDCNIHNLHAVHGGIYVAGASNDVDYVIIRGTTIVDNGYQNGVQIEFASVGISAYRLTSDHWLIEYNTLARLGDGTYPIGAYNVIRNNAFTDYEDRSAADLHVDGFQPGSDQVDNRSHDHVYERNLIGNLRNDNSHFGIWQDTWTNDDKNIIIRGNLAYHLGSGGVGNIATDYMKTYNQTFHDLDFLLAGGGNGVYFSMRNSGANYPTNCAVLNSILSDNGNRTAIGTSSTVGQRNAANLGYLAGSDASYILTSNPLFVDSTTNVWNFRLQSGSPARNVGTYLTTVSSSSGSGTSLDLTDALYFTDGYGIVDGDTITITGAGTAQITAISGNTITINSSLTWTNGAPVYWGTSTTPDLGAFPYGATELTASQQSRSGNVYTVAVTGDAREVWFYANGIPDYCAKTAPYTYTNGTDTVTSKSYALYAQATPVISSPLDNAPTITAIEDQIINQNGVSPALAFTIGDDVDSAASLTLGKSSTNTTLIPTANIVFGGSGANRTVTITPASNQTGNSTITITVTDSYSLSSQISFNVNVPPPTPVRSGKYVRPRSLRHSL